MFAVLFEHGLGREGPSTWSELRRCKLGRPLAHCQTGLRVQSVPVHGRGRLAAVRGALSPRLRPRGDAVESGVLLDVPWRHRMFEQRRVFWVANKQFEVSKFELKFPIARTFELIRARSRLFCK